MLLVNPFALGDLHGSIYDFEVAGDVLPKHNHDEMTVHITVVARGKIKAYSHDWEKEATAGQIMDFRPNEPHEIVALEDDTRIINILKKSGGASISAFSSPFGSKNVF
jgi:quercetin dioxygenase-like cupin family protein